MKRKDILHHKAKSPSQVPRLVQVEKHSLIRHHSADDLNKQIKKVHRFSDFWEDHKKNIVDQPLSQYLCEMLDKKKLKRSDVVVKSGLDKAYVYQIFAGKKNPSRDKLITIAFAMGLHEEETQKMLNLSGFKELWAKDERDALLLFAIQHRMSLQEVHTELERYGLAPLASSIK